jgi:hypothetical protein
MVGVLDSPTSILMLSSPLAFIAFGGNGWLTGSAAFKGNIPLPPTFPPFLPILCTKKMLLDGNWADLVALIEGFMGRN